MAVLSERVSLNPPAEDPAVQSLDFVGTDPSWGIYLMAHDYSPPKPDTIKSIGADVEGDVVVQTKWGNRTITAKVRVFEPSDPAAVNLITNPSAEANTTGISVAGGATAPVRTVDPLATPGALNLDTYVSTVGNANNSRLGWGFTAVAGRTYTLSAYARLVSNTATGMGISVYKGVTVIQNAATFATVGEWTRLTITFVAAESGEYTLFVRQAGAGAAEYRVTAVMAEEGAVATHYFDGDTPGCDWGGTRNESTSTRPAADGTRFSRICRDVTRQMDRLKRTKQAVLRRISAQGGPMYFDLRVGEFTEVPTTLDISRKRAEYGMSFEALPGGRGTEVLLGETEETVKPAASLTVQVPGEMPALGRLVVTDKQGVAQSLVLTGTEQTFYSAAATAETLYEAESRSPIGASSEVELAGASGGKAIKSPSLLSGWQTVLSTQAKGGGAHLSHVGTYRVWARVFRETGTGEIGLKLSWSEGDFVSVISGNENQATIAAGVGVGSYTLVDLGLVSPQPAASGTQRWEGRIAATSTVAGERVFIDYIFLQAATDGAAQMEANPTPVDSGTFAGYDIFPGNGAALAGAVAQAGGTWAGAGNGNDFTEQGLAESGIYKLWRGAFSDVANTGRYGLLGTTEPLGLTLASMAFKVPNIASMKWGLVLRYTNVENWFMAVLDVIPVGEFGYLRISLVKCVANVRTTLSTANPTFRVGGNWEGTLSAVVDGLGNAQATISLLLGNPTPPTIFASDPVLAEAGTLKKGKFGIYDEHTSAVAATRKYGIFSVQVPIVDRAIYAGRALELRSDRSRRESSDGATWGSVANTGDYLMIPPSLSEKRPARVSVKGSRSAAADAGIDDVKLQLYGTPRYLHAAPY